MRVQTIPGHHSVGPGIEATNRGYIRASSANNFFIAPVIKLGKRLNPHCKQSAVEYVRVN